MFYVKEAERSFKYTDHFIDWGFCRACNLCMSGLQDTSSFDLETRILAVIQAETVEKMRAELTEVFVLTDEYLKVPKKKERPSAENLRGTYEEMYSN